MAPLVVNVCSLFFWYEFALLALSALYTSFLGSNYESNRERHPLLFSPSHVIEIAVVRTVNCWRAPIGPDCTHISFVKKASCNTELSCLPGAVAKGFSVCIYLPQRPQRQCPPADGSRVAAQPLPLFAKCAGWGLYLQGYMHSRSMCCGTHPY